MPFKINISEKSGKTFKTELEAESLVGKVLNDKISGDEISTDFSGYEFEITGASDKSGFPSLKKAEGPNLRKVLLTYGTGLKKRSRREGKRKRGSMKPKGLRLRRTVRGNMLSEDTMQINLKVLKEGGKKLSEIFPEQNQPKEREKWVAPTA